MKLGRSFLPWCTMVALACASAGCGTAAPRPTSVPRAADAPPGSVVPPTPVWVDLEPVRLARYRDVPAPAVLTRSWLRGHLALHTPALRHCLRQAPQPVCNEPVRATLELGPDGDLSRVVLARPDGALPAAVSLCVHEVLASVQAPRPLAGTLSAVFALDCGPPPARVARPPETLMTGTDVGDAATLGVAAALGMDIISGAGGGAGGGTGGATGGANKGRGNGAKAINAAPLIPATVTAPNARPTTRGLLPG